MGEVACYKIKIAFIGAGSMAEAMISGIVNAEKIPPKQIIVSNRSNKNDYNNLKEPMELTEL